MPDLTPNQSEDWQLLEALLIGARSKDEANEAIALFPGDLADLVLGDWAADGRYDHIEALPDTTPQVAPADSTPALLWRLAYSQSVSEARRIWQESKLSRAEFNAQYWSRLGPAQKQRIRNLPA